MPDKDLRLDFLLREKLPSELKTQISNGKIRRLIMAGCVKVNDFQTRNPSFVVKKNSKVSVLIDKEKLLESAARYGKSPYGKHLQAVAEGKVRG